jgi:hypothetical protein
MKQVVRAMATAAVFTMLSAGLSSAQAALVSYRVTGFVTQSWTFDDGSRVPEGAPVVMTYTYDTQQPAESMDRHDDGSGTAVYRPALPFHFKIRMGDHRARVQSYKVTLGNDQGQPFADTYDVESVGAYIDGAWQPSARLVLSLLSQFDSTEALHSLKLPKYLKLENFDAFRVGSLWKDGDSPLVVFAVTGIKSKVCTQAAPGTDDCAE